MGSFLTGAERGIAQTGNYGTLRLLSFNMHNTDKPNIVAYLKTTCGWSEGVRAVLRKYDLRYDERDIIRDPQYRQEMVEKSGQPLSPCVEVDGKMLADVSGEEVEAYLLESGLVTPSDRAPDAPTNAPCAPAGFPLEEVRLHG